MKLHAQGTLVPYREVRRARVYLRYENSPLVHRGASTAYRGRGSPLRSDRVVRGSLVVGALKAQKEAADKKKRDGPRDPRLPAVLGQTVGSFRGGLKTFPEGLAKNLGSEIVKTEWAVKTITKNENDGSFTLVYDTPQGETTIVATTVVMTAPAYVAAAVCAEMAPKAAAALNKFYYPPVASVTVSYPETAFRLDGASALPNGGLTGFGQLHPRSQGIRTLGTIYSS